MAPTLGGPYHPPAREVCVRALCLRVAAYKQSPLPNSSPPQSPHHPCHWTIECALVVVLLRRSREPSGYLQRGGAAASGHAAGGEGGVRATGPSFPSSPSQLTRPARGSHHPPLHEAPSDPGVV